MAMTLELPDITIEELQTLHPAARCTPRLGELRVLPTKTTTTSGVMVWRWTLARPLLIDGALIQIGARTWKGHLVGEREPILAGRGPFALRAHLVDFQ